jgi:hypothetical protein
MPQKGTKTQTQNIHMHAVTKEKAMIDGVTKNGKHQKKSNSS